MSAIFPTIEVVGGGLIGTSIALQAAKNGSLVRITDQNQAHERVANELLGSSLAQPEERADCIVIATPVNHLAQGIVAALQRNPDAIVIDTGSIKSKVILEVWTILEKMSLMGEVKRFLPSHPMAGREVSGPDGARADLFAGRAWVITPHELTSPEVLTKGTRFIEEMGAVVYLFSAQEHDQQVAMTSHLPQLLASALAGVLAGPLDLAGQGLRDMTRLAHSDGAMWAPIFEGNREALLPLLTQIIKSINGLADKNFNQESVLSFMKQGLEGASKVPGKHGGVPRNYGSLSVVISDRAGQLASLFNHCADAKINIEDLRIEHSPGQEQGLISLFVKPGDLSTLNDYLSTLGWHSTITSKGI